MKHTFKPVNHAGTHIIVTGTICPSEPHVGIFFPWTDQLTGKPVRLNEYEEVYVDEKALYQIAHSQEIPG